MRCRRRKREHGVRRRGEGPVGQYLWPGLGVRSEHGVAREYRFSTCLPRASDLANLLRSWGVIVSDANAATRSQEHRASQPGFYSLFGNVMETEFVLANIDRVSRGARRGA